MPQEKFLEKYRIQSARCPNWDYSSAGAYFVTICTKDRVHYFGKIDEGNHDARGVVAAVETQNFVSLSFPSPPLPLPPPVAQPIIKYTEIGKIAFKYWNEIPDHFPFVILDEFIIMTNHVHGIMIFNEQSLNGGENVTVKTQNFASLRSQQLQSPSPQPPPSSSFSPPQNKPHQPNKFGPQSKNLGSVIRGFKSAVKSYATIHGIEFAWQSRFHDRIIRDRDEFERIKNYICNNPLNWRDDEYK